MNITTASNSERRDFPTQRIDSFLIADLKMLVRMAIREDLGRTGDLTTLALVPGGLRGAASIVARPPGVASGFELIPAMIEEMDADIQLERFIDDGSPFEAKAVLATLRGSTRDLLTCERTILNFLGRLCGIATQAQKFCLQVEGTKARLYDTRKTTPGWRRLEKYATQCGGAHNHRGGLHDAILIKDNHLACRATATGELLNPAEAVREARTFLEARPYPNLEACMIEIEIDRVSQLELALSESPDIVLLDNMSLEQLRECVAVRNQLAPQVELEASGGVRFETIAGIAATGVDRISVGGLTHSAINLDLGLDWKSS